MVPAPGLAPLALAARLGYGAWTGKSPAELEATFGRGFMDIATGGMFTGIQALGEGVRSLTGALGVEPLGDVPSSQTDIAGAAPSTGDQFGGVHAAVERARETGELTRQTPPELLREARAYREV